MELRRVLVAVDFSPASVAAARWVAEHFARDAELVLAHVVSIPTPPRFLRGRFPQLQGVTETARTGAEEQLQALARTLPTAPVRLEVRSGEPAAELAALARTVNADVIAIGRHGARAGLWERLGTTADRLVRTSPVPVLLATGPLAAAPRRLLVAVDDSDITPEVVRWTRLLAQRSGAEVTAMHVVSAAVLSHVLSLAAVTIGRGEIGVEDVRVDFRVESDRWIGALLAGGVQAARVESEVAFGEPAQELLAAAERLGSDLLVVGRRGAGNVRRALLGSVVGEVLRGARCPVLVVVEPEDELVPHGS